MANLLGGSCQLLVVSWAAVKDDAFSPYEELETRNQELMQLLVVICQLPYCEQTASGGCRFCGRCGGLMQSASLQYTPGSGFRSNKLELRN
jgi:hypothetical protein